MVYTFGILSLCQSSLQTITRIKHIIKFTCDSKSYTCTSKNCTFGQKKEKITTLQIECDERIMMECKNVNVS